MGRLFLLSYKFFQLRNIDPFVVEKYMSIVRNEVDWECLAEQALNYVLTMKINMYSTSSQKSFKTWLNWQGIKKCVENIFAPRMWVVCSNVVSWVPRTVVRDGEQIFSVFQSIESTNDDVCPQTIFHQRHAVNTSNFKIRHCSRNILVCRNS